MKHALYLQLMPAVLVAGLVAFGGPAMADTPATPQLKTQTTTPPPPPPPSRFKATTPTPPPPTGPGSIKGNTKPTHPPAGPGSYQGAPTFSCANGYTKTKLQKGPYGNVSVMECLGPIITCPAPEDNPATKGPFNVGSPGIPNGMNIQVEKVLVPMPGESNRFRIKYQCTYYFNQG